MNQKALGITAAAIMILSATIDSSSDKEAENDAYCEAVIAWDYSSSHGLEPNDRAGHPNYKGVDCYDDESEDELKRLGLTSSR